MGRQCEVRLQLDSFFVILIRAANIAQGFIYDGSIVVRDVRTTRAHVQASIDVPKCIIVLAQCDVRGTAIDISLAEACVDAGVCK